MFGNDHLKTALCGGAAVSLRQHSYPSEGSDFDPSITRDGRKIIFASTRHALNPDICYKDVDD